MTYQPPQGPQPHYSSGQAPIPPPPETISPIAASRPRAGILRRLGAGQKAAVYVGGAVLAVLLCSGGIAAIGAISGPEPDPPAKALPAGATAAPSSAVPTTAVAQPVIEKRTVTETQKIPFAEKTVQDSSLAKGSQKVRTQGVAGVKTVTYELTITDGVQTAKTLVRQMVTRAPVTRVTAIGTKESRNCDPNYSGACVPVASDVDCAGGSGNGPAYVDGPVEVIGDDIYDLDRDGDGTGCDN